MGDLDEFLAALLGEVGHAQPDDLALGLRVEAEVRGADRLFDGDDQAPVPHADLQHAGLRHRDGGNLGERHVGAIGIDMDGLEQAGGGAAGAQAAEIMLQRVDGAMHAALEVLRVEIGGLGHGVNPSSLW